MWSRASHTDNFFYTFVLAKVLRNWWIWSHLSAAKGRPGTSHPAKLHLKISTIPSGFNGLRAVPLSLTDSMAYVQSLLQSLLHCWWMIWHYYLTLFCISGWKQPVLFSISKASLGGLFERTRQVISNNFIKQIFLSTRLVTGKSDIGGAKKKARL